MRSLVLAAVLVLPPRAHADPDPDPAARARGGGLVLTDGKQHYVVFDLADPLGSAAVAVYYGDGKTFEQIVQTSRAGSADGATRRVTLSLRDRRYGVALGVSRVTIESTGGGEVQCRDRTTRLTPVPDAKARQLLRDAKFKLPRLTRIPIALGHRGATYYYVDATTVHSDPGVLADFRIYIGRKGALVEQRIETYEEEPQHITLGTKRGTIRVEHPGTAQAAASWQVGDAQVALTWLDTHTSPAKIVGGKRERFRFGTPCDHMQ